MVKSDLYIGRRCYTTNKVSGWKLPQNKWFNPYKVDIKTEDRNDIFKVLKLYKQYILSSKELLNSLYELEGLKLGCWCSPEPSWRSSYRII